MPREQPPNIYRDQLTSLYHGLALWNPDPVEDIYDQVSIGDVGYISSEGRFIRFFNVTLPWDSQSNRRLAQPEPYDPLTQASITRENFGPVNRCSRTVSGVENAENTQADTPAQTEGITYTCRGPGAFQSLPCGGVREDAMHRNMFGARIRDNVDRWFGWSRNIDLPVGRMDDIILVTGCTLVASYALATFDHHDKVSQISLTSQPLNNGGASFVWGNIHGTVEYRDSQVNPNLPSTPRNRCVFIRGFRARRAFFFSKTMRAQAEPRRDDPDDSDDFDDFYNPGDDRTKDIQVNRVPSASKGQDPLNGVFDYIVEKSLEAADAVTPGVLAIVHDDDLQIIKSKHLETFTAYAVLKFLRENKIPVLIENGVATLQDENTRNQSRGDQVPQGEDSRLDILIGFGGDVAAQNKDGDTAIHLASQRGQANVVRMLIKRGANTTAKNKDGNTPLHMALSRYRGQVDDNCMLIKHGTDVTAQDKDKTLLYQASRQGHVDVTRVLLEHGADTTAQNNDGDTPLHIASYQGQVDVARMLVEDGADMSAQNKDGDIPLHVASSQGQVDVARFLIGCGAYLMTAKNTDGDTPLHLALSQGQVDVVRMFVERGADLTTKNTNGDTPLHVASTQGEVDVVCMLLELGPDVEARNTAGKTPLQLALRQGHFDVADLLRMHGAGSDVTRY